MLCQFCNKNIARFHTLRIQNNTLVEVHYCEECGKKRCDENGDHCLDDKMQRLLEGLINSKISDRFAVEENRCDVCGTSTRDVKRKRSLGCPNCYEVFSEIIERDFKTAKKLYGKLDYMENAEHIQKLRNGLKEAVQLEDFEKAAFLRDRIREIEREEFRDH